MTQLRNPYKEILSRFNSCFWFICYSELKQALCFRPLTDQELPRERQCRHCSCQPDVIWDEGSQKHPGAPKGWEQGTTVTCPAPQGTSLQKIKLKATLLQIKREIVTLTEDGGTFSPTLCLKAQSIKSVPLSQVFGISKDGDATVSPSSTSFSAWPPSILFVSFESVEDFPCLNLNLLPSIMHLQDKPDWPKIVEVCLVSQRKNLNKQGR